MSLRRTLVGAGTVLLTAAGLTIPTAPAVAAGEQVNIFLTTTNDADGLNVTRGLQQQTPVNFQPGTGSGQVTVNVDENTSTSPSRAAARRSPTRPPG